MNEARSLRSALEDSANRAASGAGPLATERILALGRRRRRARQTGSAVVALSAAAAVVLAGAAVADLQQDRTADESASGNGYALCGATTAGLGWRDTAHLRRLDVTTSGPRVDRSGVLTVTTDLADTGEPIAGAGGAPSFVVVDRATGTVVGVLGAAGDADPEERVDVPAGSDATVTTTAPLLSCATQDGSTTLDPGTYTLVGSRTVWVGDPARAALAVSSWDVVVGGDVATTAPDGPTCGATVPEGVSTDQVVVTAQAPRSGTAGRPTGAVHSVTNDGRTTVGIGAAQAMVVQDGRVVALSDGRTGVGTGSALHPDETWTQDVPFFSLERCVPDGSAAAPLMPGELELWTWVPIEADGVTSGRLTGPVPFTVLASTERPAVPACGASAEGISGSDLSTVLTLTAHVEEAARKPGVVTVISTLGAIDGLRLHVLREDDSLVLVRDGVVVAVDEPGEGEAGSVGAIGGRRTGQSTSGMAWEVAPQSCSSGEPLPAGDYDAWPVAWVTVLGAEDTGGALRPGPASHGWLVGEPTTVTLSGPAGD